MKKLLILLFPIFIFAYEIDFNKTFSRDLMPNVLSANISITIEDKKERLVINRLNIFGIEMKQYKKVEKKLGTFNVRPVYQHSSNSPLIKGYIGELRYEISTNDALFMGEFVSLVTSLKDNRDTSVSLGNLSWKVKSDSYSVALDVLRLEAINWGENYTKILSQDLRKECELKHISFSNYNQRPIAYATRALSSLSTAQKDEMVIPELTEEEISLNTSFKLECK